MQSDDAMPSNQPPLWIVARSAQLPGIPPFLMLVTFYPRHKTKHRKWAAGIPGYAHPPENISCSLSHWHEVPQVAGLWGSSWQWCVSWLLSTVLVVSLGRPQPGSGRGPGLGDVITSFIGGRHSRIRTPPRISHTLTAPFASRPSHSSLSTVIHRPQHRAQTHVRTHTQAHTHAGLCLFCILDCRAQGSLELWACALKQHLSPEREAATVRNKDRGSAGFDY